MDKVVEFKPSNLPAGLYKARCKMYARCSNTLRYVKKGEAVTLLKGEANKKWEPLSVSAHADKRSANIINAVNRLDPDNNAHWTEVGLPKVEVVQSFSEDSSVKREDIKDLCPDINRDSVALQQAKKKGAGSPNNFGQGRRKTTSR